MTATRPFTSALGTREAFAVAHAGFVPIRQVMGASFHTLGWRERLTFTPSAYAGADPDDHPYYQQAAARRATWRRPIDVETVELQKQTAAWNTAREQAIDGLRAEAAACGADLVLGVRIKRLRRDWMTDLVEFAVTGTAVRSRRYAVGEDDAPLLSTLSGQDVAKLTAHGFWPVGIAGGSTVAQVMSTFGEGRRPGLLRRWRNEEVPDWTVGMREAYGLALRRVERGAHAVHATGVVGVELERHVQEREREANDTTYHDLVVEVHALGTAIAEVRNGAALPPFKYITLPLS